MPNLLYGMHDEEGRHVVPSGGWCVALVSLQSYRPVDFWGLRADLNWLVRVNWGYGSVGTIPLPQDDNEYLRRYGDWLSRSSGMHSIIVGNEPNHEQERPQGAYISPERYASFFNRVRSLTKQVAPKVHVIPAAIAPYHASPAPWTQYMNTMLNMVDEPDGIAIHAYARSSSPASIIDPSYMGPPLENTFSGFLTYRDAMAATPSALRSKPFYITEFNELLPDGWENNNTGIVEAAYREIYWFNLQKYPEKVHCLCLYRWPKYDKWHIEGKQGVIDDFRYAVSLNYPSPPEPSQNDTEGQEGGQNVVYVPSIQNNSNKPSSPSTPFERAIDIRALQRGVSIVETDAPHAWKVRKIQWYDEQEADRVGPDHHLLVDTLDEAGNRVVGVQLKVVWPTGFHTMTSEAKPGEIAAANYPMSPSRNEFSVLVSGDLSSEVVRGIGMGMDTPSGFNPGIHTSTLVVFQRVRAAQSAGEISIRHPIADPNLRRISQKFGVNREFYSRFSVDGVSLRGHNGVDFAVPIGTPVVAVDEGKVVEVADDPDGYGLYVKLVHHWGESLYAHLSEQLVRVGQQVIAGATLGFSGNTGLSTGPHLHFGMRVAPFNRKDGWGGFLDPLRYLQEHEQTPHAPPVAKSSIPDALRTVANESGLQLALLASLAWAESSFRPALQDGLFQIGPQTWQDFGSGDIYNPLDNARTAAAYLKWLLGRLDNNLYDALVAYNFGIGNVLAGKEPPELTKHYVNKVLHGRDLLVAMGVK